MKLQWKMLRRGQNSEIEGIIKFMKEQCIRYDNILTNSKVRIRTDLIEKTTELKRCMQKEDMDERHFPICHFYSSLPSMRNMYET